MIFTSDRPDPNNRIAAASRTFITERASQCDAEAKGAERRADNARAKFDENVYAEGVRIAEAEQDAETAAAVHAHAERKLVWEQLNRWAARVTPSEFAPQPWQHDRPSWLAIFKPRQTKPN